MTEQDKNRFMKKRLEIKRLRERRRRFIAGLLAVCFTGLLACGIGLFCRHLLIQHSLGDVSAMADLPLQDPVEMAAGMLPEPEAVPEPEALPRWDASELGELKLVYSAFINDRGWNLPHRSNSYCMAAAGEYLTAVSVRVENQAEGMTGTIEYSVNVSGDGWQDWSGNGEAAGVTDRPQPIESVRVRFSGELSEYYDLYYSVLQDNVWGEWVKNGEDAGLAAAGKRVSGIRLSSIKNADRDTVYPGQVDPSKPMIALTFDDGPSKTATPRILDVLEYYDSRATFFMVGSRVPGHSEIVRRMQEQGSEVANHTMNHKAMRNISDAAYMEQLVSANQVIVDACGVSPVLMRPCEGYVNVSGMNIVGSVGMSGILWTVDTLDWKSRDPEKIIEKALGDIRDGDIILLHDLYDTTADACEIIIPALIESGYQLVTVSELAAYRGGVLPGKTYGFFR